MFKNKEYRLRAFAYRDVETGNFYRSDKHAKYYYESELEEFIENNANDLVDLYVSKWVMNEKGEKISAPYFDIDHQDLDVAYRASLKLYYHLKDMFKLNDYEIAFIFSGAKGFHIEMAETSLGLTKIPLKNNKEFLRWFAKKIEKELHLEGLIDFRVYEPKRLWRMEKTVNSKSGLFCHRLDGRVMREGIESILNYCKYQRNYNLFQKQMIKSNSFARMKILMLYKEFDGWYKNRLDTRITPNRLEIEKDELPPCIMSLLSKSIPEGKRNMSLYVVARALAKLFNLSPDEIYNFTVNWALDIGLNETEIYPTIQSACNSEEDFSCLGSSYVGQLIDEKVAICPYIGQNFKETKILKMTLCPVYRSIKSIKPIEDIRGKFSTNIAKLYNDVKKYYKEKKWYQARETINTIYKLKTTIVEEVKKWTIQQYLTK